MAVGMREVAGPEEKKALRGGCVCGAITFEVIDAFRYSMNCHCFDCRKATGSAFKPFAGIERSKLSITKGEEEQLLFGDENGHDVRCRSCGSLLFSVVQEGAFVHVALGSLIDAPSMRPTAHIFVSERAPWFEITDGLPQFPGHMTHSVQPKDSAL
jgi:hypothetical protein